MARPRTPLGQSTTRDAPPPITTRLLPPATIPSDLLLPPSAADHDAQDLHSLRALRLTEVPPVQTERSASSPVHTETHPTVRGLISANASVGQSDCQNPALQVEGRARVWSI